MARIDRNMGSTALKAALVAVLVPAMLGGCTSIKDRRGYIADPVLTGAVTPGLDNRESVQGTLGQPSFASQFGDPVWYYVSSTTEQRIFGQPEIEDHKVLKIAFDSAGNVASVTNATIDDVRDINPDGDKTPTLGRHRGFLQDLFGNIGAVGAGGMGGAAGGSNGS
ncbi:outer membrane protein assembly factor BamE [Croceicoccus bisphenolivorans]|uniref:outer membrane protein assembly factor BamE n=1 Tax=Croceicoccus bisphenolivorans TaxID=1783232 RepID=UPI000A407FC4|nr:outer membrane protein assembly factor BamE [Croceicoccus bisphenolivorans]